MVVAAAAAVAVETAPLARKLELALMQISLTKAVWALTDSVMIVASLQRRSLLR